MGRRRPRQRDLHIRRRTYYRNGAYHTGPPKSERSARTIAFADQIEQPLRTHKLQQNERILASHGAVENNGLVFTNERGGFLHGPVLRRRMQRILEEAELPKRTFHQLRHTAASVLLAQGATLKDIQETRGRPNCSLTANVYAHLWEESRREVAGKMGTEDQSDPYLK